MNRKTLFSKAARPVYSREELQALGRVRTLCRLGSLEETIEKCTGTLLRMLIKQANPNPASTLTKEQEKVLLEFLAPSHKKALLVLLDERPQLW